MAELIHIPLERWFRFHLAMLSYTLETQTQLGQAWLGALETAAGRRTGKPEPGRPGPSALDPRDPIIPKDLPPLLRAQWMLGMLFAGWRLPAA